MKLKFSLIYMLIILLSLTTVTINALAQEPGQILWKELYGGSEEDVFYDLQQTSDDGYIMVGYTTTYGPVSGVKSLWIVKTDSAGTVQWTKVMGDGFSYGDWGNSVAVCPDGSYVIVGETYSYAQNEKDAWIVKLDSSGDILWTQTYSGLSYEVANAVIINNAGNYAITGYKYDDTGNREALLLEYDPNGNLLLDKTYGGSDEEWTTDICQTDDSGYVLTGYTKSFGATGQDLYLIRVDVNGDTVWTFQYGGANDQFGRAVEVMDDGNIITSGWSGLFGNTSDIILLKISSFGSLLWNKIYSYGMFDTSNDMIITMDGGFLMTGKGDDDFLALKTSEDGTEEWVENSFNATGIGVIQNNSGDYMLAGAEHVNYIAQGLLICLQGDPYNQPPGDFDLLEPENGDTLSSMTEPVVFIWESAPDPENDPIMYTLNIFNSDINLLYPFINDTTYTLNGSTFLVENTTYYWAVSAYDGMLTTISDTSAFFTPSSVGIGFWPNHNKACAVISVSPNPSNGIFHINIQSNEVSSANICVYNTTGKLVARINSIQALNNNIEVDLSGQDAGMYIVKYNYKNQNKFVKLLKQ